MRNLKKYQRGNIVVAVATPGGDPQFNNVTFLMSCEEGVVGAENITPTVGPRMDWAGGGGSQPGDFDGEISIAQAKFGTRSIYFKETGGVPNAGWFSLFTQAGDLYAFTGDFTVECDIFILDSTSVIEIFGNWDFTDREWRWALEAGNRRMDFLISLTGSNNDTVLAQQSWGGATNGVPENAWQHIAVCRENDDWFAWLNGVQSDQGTVVNSGTIFIPTTCFFVLGQQCNACGAGNVEAYLDNVRITDGFARYTAPFTPPTEAHPDFF